MGVEIRESRIGWNGNSEAWFEFVSYRPELSVCFPHWVYSIGCVKKRLFSMRLDDSVGCLYVLIKYVWKEMLRFAMLIKYAFNGMLKFAMLMRQNL